MSGPATGRAGAAAGPPPLTVLEAALGVAVEPALLERALTHRSYAYEHGGLPTNERLEFLGDAVLGLVVTHSLYEAHPDLPEGQLAKLRSAVVNMRALADTARSLGPAGLGVWLRLGRGEEVTGGRDKASILADTLEAVLGAVYLSGGIEHARRVVSRLFDGLMADSALLGAGLDWKTSLQELAAAGGLGAPEYVVTETGPDHAKAFTATAVVAGVPHGTGAGRNKKEAEQRAAERAWTALSGGGADPAIESGPGADTVADGAADPTADLVADPVADPTVDPVADPTVDPAQDGSAPPVPA